MRSGRGTGGRLAVLAPVRLVPLRVVARIGAKPKKKTAGRRRNYAPAADAVGIRKYLPVDWVNWFGLALFGVIFIALAAETVHSIAQSRGSDIVAAALTTVGFGYMVYLFGTTRLRQ
jgi:hypothetical protein